VANTLLSLAFALNAAGQPADAEPLLREAVEMSRRLYAGPHGSTANALDRYGSVLSALGRPAEAEPVLREALAMRIGVLGAGHNDVQLVRVSLGNLSRRLGRDAAAESLFTQALDARRALYGPSHGAVGGRVALGDSLAGDALRMQRVMVPAGNVALVGPIVTLASLRARAGDTTGLAALTAEARSLLGTRPASASILVALGESLCAIGRDSAATDVLRRGLAAATSLPGDTVIVRRGRETLARCTP
jgi:tetratricopeptide (TPR) repeat protein